MILFEQIPGTDMSTMMGIAQPMNCRQRRWTKLAGLALALQLSSIFSPAAAEILNLECRIDRVVDNITGEPMDLPDLPPRYYSIELSDGRYWDFLYTKDFDYTARTREAFKLDDTEIILDSKQVQLGQMVLASAERIDRTDGSYALNTAHLEDWTLKISRTESGRCVEIPPTAFPQKDDPED